MKNTELILLLMIGMICFGVGSKYFIDEHIKETRKKELYEQAQNKMDYNETIYNKLPTDCLHPITRGHGDIPYYNGPSGKEDYVNISVSYILDNAYYHGYDEKEYSYWENEYGLQMFGSYIIVASDYDIHPYGSIVQTSLGEGIVLDTGSSVTTSCDTYYTHDIDIYTNWY